MLLLPLWGLSPPHNALFLRPSPLIIPNNISIGSAVFVWVANAMLYNAMSIGKKRTPPKMPFSFRFLHLTGG